MDIILAARPIESAQLWNYLRRLICLRVPQLQRQILLTPQKLQRRREFTAALGGEAVPGALSYLYQRSIGSRAEYRQG
jgi:hypothetical protein